MGKLYCVCLVIRNWILFTLRTVCALSLYVLQWKRGGDDIDADGGGGGVVTCVVVAVVY